MTEFEIERINSDENVEPLQVEVERYINDDPNGIIVIRFKKTLEELTQGDLLSMGNALKNINKHAQKRIYFVTSDVDVFEIYGESATRIILEKSI